MGEIAIFTKELVEGLIAKGYEPVAITKKAYYFEDSIMLRCALDELIEALGCE